MGDNVEYHQGEQLRIQLSRPDSSTPWGFRLQGGVDFSTPLSVQSVQPGSVAERCGLQAGDGILFINNANTDQLSHDQAKQEIVRSANDIHLLVQRGAVKIWKPSVTPLSQLRPDQLRTIKSATGDDVQAVQKTSLAINKPPDEPCRIGSSHNRSPMPFGNKQASAKIVHSQYNSPMGLYSASNIANTYAAQTAGIEKELGGIDLEDKPVGTVMSGTYQPLAQGESATQRDLAPGEEPNYQDAYTNPHAQSRTFHKLQEDLDRQESENAYPGFRSVSAPTAKPPDQRPAQKPSMRCGACDMLATGVIVKAGGVPYHMACFKCAACGVNLKQKGYFVVEEKLYCETHARRMAQPPNPDMVAVPVYR